MYLLHDMFTEVFQINISVCLFHMEKFYLNGQFCKLKADVFVSGLNKRAIFDMLRFLLDFSLCEVIA